MCIHIFCTGIGRDTAKMLVKCGAEVIALSRTQSDLDSLRQEVCSIIYVIIICPCCTASMHIVNCLQY